MPQHLSAADEAALAAAATSCSSSSSAHGLKEALAGVTQPNAALLKRRSSDESRELARSLDGLEVRESSWAEWEEASVPTAA